MRSQVHRSAVWAILGTFLFFSASLPLGHVCLHNLPNGRPSYSNPGSRDMSWQLQKAGKNHQDGFCMACLLGQSLILDSGAVELNVSGAASYALDCLYAPVAAITGSFQSPSNRAPPTGC